jgi:hypothetical protein
VNTELILEADKLMLYFQLGVGCAILGLLVMGRLLGLL